MQPMTVATGSREHDASKHGITVMARRVVITVVFLLVLGHTRRRPGIPEGSLRGLQGRKVFREDAGSRPREDHP